MSNLFTQQGVDFDTWFGVGQGSQFLNIYGDNGQDIGQTYLAGSGGPETSWYTPDGQDLNTKFGGYGYGIYRVGGYPWNFHWGDFNLSNHVEELAEDLGKPALQREVRQRDHKRLLLPGCEF